DVVRTGGQQPAEGGVEALAQAGRALARQRRGLLPAFTQGAQRLVQRLGGLLGRRRAQALQLREDRLARRDAGLEIDLVAALVALEEAIAGGVEAPPERFGLAATHGAEGLPFGLQPLDRVGGRLPVGGNGEGLRASEERLLALEVPGPLLLALVEIFVAAREEPIARLAETLPQGLLVAARRGLDRLPLRLQALDGLRRPGPFGRGGERFGLLAQRLLARRLLDMVGLQARQRLVARPLEAQPELLRLVLRDLGGRLPPFQQLGDLPRRLGRVGDLAQGFGAGAQLLLHGRVGPALPALRLAQLLHLRRQGGAQRLEPLQQLPVLATGGKRRQVV